MLALKWQTGFPSPFGGFSASCRGGGEYLSCSLWQQRISVLLEPSAILLFQSVFLKCALAGARQGGQKSDTTWQMAGEISKSVWRTLGERTPLWSQLQEGESKQFIWAACYADPNLGETYATEAPLSWRQLLGTCTDVNLGQCAHKLALICCLSSKNRTIFLQRTWKWRILHSLVAYSRASQLWRVALGAYILGCQSGGT